MIKPGLIVGYIAIVLLLIGVMVLLGLAGLDHDATAVGFGFLAVAVVMMVASLAIRTTADSRRETSGQVSPHGNSLYWFMTMVVTLSGYTAVCFSAGDSAIDDKEYVYGAIGAGAAALVAAAITLSVDAKHDKADTQKAYEDDEAATKPPGHRTLGGYVLGVMAIAIAATCSSLCANAQTDTSSEYMVAPVCAAVLLSIVAAMVIVMVVIRCLGQAERGVTGVKNAGAYARASKHVSPRTGTLYHVIVFMMLILGCVSASVSIATSSRDGQDWAIAATVVAWIGLVLAAGVVVHEYRRRSM